MPNDDEYEDEYEDESVDEEENETEVEIRIRVPQTEGPLQIIAEAVIEPQDGENFKIESKDAVFVRALDAQRERKAAIFGGGFLLSEKAAAEKAAAQEAAQQPALNLWNASLGLNGSTNSALAAAAGKGTTKSTQITSGGGGLLSGLLGGL